jgi:mono/diheme cytochrome c family protein
MNAGGTRSEAIGLQPDFSGRSGAGRNFPVSGLPFSPITGEAAVSLSSVSIVGNARRSPRVAGCACESPAPSLPDGNLSEGEFHPMRTFALGFITALLLPPLAVFAFVRLGFVNPRADIPVNRLEQRVAMPSLDAAVARRAAVIPEPLDSSDATLLAGMKIYETSCASCHGDGSHPDAALADALYPRAPQFAREAPDMPPHENLYIITHGVRMSGMPAWGRVLSVAQLLQVTSFLAHMGHLPPPIADRWNAGAELGH